MQTGLNKFHIADFCVSQLIFCEFSKNQLSFCGK